MRLVFEACSFAGSLVGLGIDNVNRIALEAQSRGNPMEFTSLERHMLFVSAWSIVDQIHTFGSLVHSSSDLIKLDVAQLNPFLYSARKLRNGMDHAPQNLRKKGNLIGTKQTPSLFGVITINKIDPEDCSNGMIDHLTVLCVIGGSAFESASFSLQPAHEAFTSAPSVLPFDNFMLHAYGLVLNLSRAAVAVSSVITAISAAVESLWETTIKKHVEKNEVNATELSKPRAGNCTIVAVAAFDPMPFNVKVVT